MSILFDLTGTAKDLLTSWDHATFGDSTGCYTTNGLPRTDVYQCLLCRKFFLRANPPVHCAVLHPSGQCCHYGDTEVTVTFARKSKKSKKGCR